MDVRGEERRTRSVSRLPCWPRRSRCSRLFQWLPPQTEQTHFGVTRPALLLAPLLWLGIAIHCWRGRAGDRMLRALAWTAPVLVVGNLVMLYSPREGDPQSIVAHLGTLVGYLVLLLLLLKLASVEMTERVRAESQLAQLIDEQERRVRERTADLEAEVAVRREAEENAQSQLQRLNLLHQITRATSDRKDLHSIYDVVVRSLEEQLPVDLCCLCLYDAGSNVLTVSKVGPRCTALARQLGLTERARLAVDSDALTHSIRGTPVSEPDTSLVTSPLSQRLAQARLAFAGGFAAEDRGARVRRADRGAPDGAGLQQRESEVPAPAQRACRARRASGAALRSAEAGL